MTELYCPFEQPEKDDSLRVFVCSVWGQVGDVGSEGLWSGDIKLLLVAFDSRLKVFYMVKNDNKSKDGYGVWQKMDTPYWNCEYAFSCEDLELIRTISFLGYGQRIRDLEIQREIHDDETLSNPSDWYDEENPFGARRQNLRGTNHDDPLRNFGMKIDISEFVGKAHLDEFIDWLSTVERIFNLRDVPEKLNVKLVAIKLRKSASLWCNHVKNQRVKDGKSKVETWAKMKKLLLAKFLPVNHRQEAFIEYHNFSQRASSSVEDFVAEFDRLRMRCDVDKEEEQVIAQFLGALQPHIADVADVGIGTTAKPTNSRVLCCFKCQGLGQVARECPNKKLVTIVDDTTPVYDTEKDEDVVQDIDELVRDTTQHLSDLQQVFCVLREQKPYANEKKCHFLANKVIFLGYLVSGEGIQMDASKIEAIMSWPTPTTIHDIRGQFTWTKEADKAFSELKQRVTQAPVLALPNFEEVFHVVCDASGLGIEGVLSQNKRPIAFFSEKFNEARR
nr:reverse transcriptase domain-containing protein [Tanacetum cinerariifolium]